MGGPSIYATWNNPANNRKRMPFDEPGLFGFEQPHAEYSFNEQITNYVEMISCASERYRRIRRKPLSQRLIVRSAHHLLKY
jgi:hypothetical protein